MPILVVSLIALALDAFSFVPALAWFSIVGFGMGVSAWAMGRRYIRCGVAVGPARAGTVIAVAATFFGLVCGLLFFVIGGLLAGFSGIAAY